VSRDLPLMDVDAPAVERVIANLVHNAVKYATPGSHIRIAARVAHRAFELRVEDNGPGIPPEDREQIFVRFYRRPDAAASGRPGVGLGLAICLSIVNAHGGRIWAGSRPGGGTRFTVSLPLTPEKPDRTREGQALHEVGASVAAKPRTRHRQAAARVTRLASTATGCR
jgi:two-component system, OmpR family, sensor histidine kinase KdpD